MSDPPSSVSRGPSRPGDGHHVAAQSCTVRLPLLSSPSSDNFHPWCHRDHRAKGKGATEALPDRSWEGTVTELDSSSSHLNTGG
jgi:hypothetical protein